MAGPFLGTKVFKMSNGASPEVYYPIEKIKDISGVGKTNPLIDVTNFDSTAKENIAGLADGNQITVSAFRVHQSPSIQDALVAKVNSGANANFSLTLTDTSVSPNVAYTYTFAATCLSWEVVPAIEGATEINFTLKISGDVTVA